MAGTTYYTPPNNPNPYANMQNQEGFMQPNFFPPTNYANPNQYSAPPQNFAPNTYAFTPQSAMTDVAMQYGSAFVAQGSDLVQKSVDTYMSTRLKYYFAVNNSYVAKKLGLILFPFAHTKWATEFDPSGPVPPGDDVNAPDLYIPLMAFITYILISGATLGVQGRFTPEQLGILSSEAFGWLLLEVLILLLCIYILSVQSTMSYLDVVSFSSYKFVSMIAIIVCYVFLDLPGYYFSLLYASLALSFFLIRTLKLKILPHADTYSSGGNKRCIYLLLLIALIQPFLMWWMTRRMLWQSPSAKL